MTINQVIASIRSMLENHAMIHSVKYATPVEWINYANDPILPIALFSIEDGLYERSYQNNYSIKFWLLDKSGSEAEFETEVISDMHNVGRDIVNAMSLTSNNDYSIEFPIQWTGISERFEDFLSGVSFTIRIQTNGNNTYCDFPSIT